MKYPVEIEGFEGQSIEVQPPGILSSARLLVNGQPAPRGQKRNQMILRRDDGQEAIATWRPQAWGLDIPQLSIDGKTIQVAEPLKWYEWLWAGLPVLLLFVGGAIGALVGVIALFINRQVFHSSLSELVKFLVAAAVTVLSVVAYFILAMLFSIAIGR